MVSRMRINGVLPLTNQSVCLRLRYRISPGKITTSVALNTVLDKDDKSLLAC
jgi:hypothetical protein